MPCYTVLSYGMLCQKRLGYAVVSKAMICCFVISHKNICFAMLSLAPHREAMLGWALLGFCELRRYFFSSFTSNLPYLRR